MAELQLLDAAHAQAVLAFELENRAYFRSWIPDRGDDYFDDFQRRHDLLLSEQADGRGYFYVLVADNGSVLGRFNLSELQDGAAWGGYRRAEKAAGQGTATSTVNKRCRIAALVHGLSVINAAAADDNPASQKVLLKAGFEIIGPASNNDLDGQQGLKFRRDLQRWP